MLIQLPAVILLVSGFIYTVLWTGSGVRTMLHNWSEERREEFYAKMKRVSLPITFVSIVFLLVIGRLTALNWFNLVFYLCFIPLIFIWNKSRREKTPLLETQLFDKGYQNFLLVETPLSYIYVVVWLDLLFTFIDGAPGMYQ